MWRSSITALDVGEIYNTQATSAQAQPAVMEAVNELRARVNVPNLDAITTSIIC